MSESELIRYIGQHPAIGSPAVRLGVGDDAAVLAAGRSDMVVTVDMLADGTDFIVGQVDPELIGRKALAVNLSDIAAMAAEPIAAFPAVMLPRDGGLQLGCAIHDGMRRLADEFGVAIAGGDTNSWDGRLVVSVTVIGRVINGNRPLRRDGAQPGDRILVTGRLGGSIMDRQFTFTPRVREAIQLADEFELHAGMDISDGLLIDLSRMIQASQVGAELQLDAVPITDDAKRLARSQGDQLSALDHALADGEDFELLLAVPPDVAQEIVRQQPLGDTPITDIGRFTAKPGLWEITETERRPAVVRGYQHQFD